MTDSKSVEATVMIPWESFDVTLEEHANLFPDVVTFTSDSFPVLSISGRVILDVSTGQLSNPFTAQKSVPCILESHDRASCPLSPTAVPSVRKAINSNRRDCPRIGPDMDDIYSVPGWEI
jgi:hypothetical protein